MKKFLKMLGTMALAATLAVGTVSMVGATTGNYTITINDASGATDSSAGNTYTLYKVADFNVSGGVYTNIEAATGFTSLQSKIEALAGKAYDSTDAVNLANEAADMTSDATAVSTFTVSTANKSFSVTETGYYLVVDTAHSATNPYLTTKYMLVAVDGLAANLSDADNNENIYVKTSKASVEKKIVSEHNNALEDANTVAVGDTVTYQLDASIPSYASDAAGITYKLTDTMSSGLTYTGIKSVQVSANGNDWTDATYTSTGNVNTAGATVVITLTDVAQIRSNTYVRAVLTAALNESANKGASGNPNSVDLTYSNNYYGGGDSFTTPEDTVITYTGELKIVKVDAADQKKLSGAVFDIYRLAVEGDNSSESLKIGEEEKQVVKVATTTATDSEGKTTVSGLDVGTYYAVETTAPEGYSVDATPIELALTVANTDLSLDGNGDAGSGDKLTNYTNTDAANANSTAVTNYAATWQTAGNSEKTITNTKGITLPGTGGIGTTIFTFGGLALVILAAVLFIAYTRKQKKQA